MVLFFKALSYLQGSQESLTRVHAVDTSKISKIGSLVWSERSRITTSNYDDHCSEHPLANGRDRQSTASAVGIARTTAPGAPQLPVVTSSRKDLLPQTFCNSSASSGDRSEGFDIFAAEDEEKTALERRSDDTPMTMESSICTLLDFCLWMHAGLSPVSLALTRGLQPYQ